MLFKGEFKEIYRTNLVTGILLAGNLLLVVLSLISYWVPYIHPSEGGWFSNLGLAPLALLLLNLVFIFLWLIIRPGLAIISAAAFLFGLPMLSRLIAFPIQKKETINGETLRIASYNMQFSKPVIGLETKIKAFRSYLKSQQDLDILAVQECGPRSRHYIRQNISFPYQYFPENMLLGIYSKYPILNSGYIDFGFNRVNTCLWIDVLIRQDTVRVYNTHLEANRYDGIVPEVVDQDNEEKITPTAILGIFKHYRYFSGIRSNQATAIRNHQLESPFPSLICGDLNEPPGTHTYTIISRDLKDSFLEAGRGIGSTHGGSIPGLRIDYVLTDHRFQVKKHENHNNSFSDHYLVRSEIVLNK